MAAASAALRACLEAELLTDEQQRLALLSRDMDNQNGICDEKMVDRGQD
jgi:hypothetical protein